jgi:hypothetical protein
MLGFAFLERTRAVIRTLLSFGF